MKTRESQCFVCKEVATWSLGPYVEATSSPQTRTFRNEESWVRGSNWAPELEALGRGLGPRAEASHRRDTSGAINRL